MSQKLTINFHISRVYRLVLRAVGERLADIGLKNSSLYYAVLELHLQDGLTMSELSDILAVDKSFMTKEIKKLIKLGYVTQQVDPADRRIQRVYLTESGRAAAERVGRAFSEVLGILGQDIDPAELQVVFAVWAKLYANARNHLTRGGG